MAQRIVEIQLGVTLEQLKFIDVSIGALVQPVITSRILKFDGEAQRIENVMHTDIGARSQ